MKIAVTGSRHQTCLKVLVDGFYQFEKEHGQITEMVLGDCRGTDTLAKQLCDLVGIPYVIEYANWKLYPRSAGPIRNGKMLDHKPEWLIAFPGGNGTRDCTNQALRRCIPVFVVPEVCGMAEGTELVSGEVQSTPLYGNASL
jgi:hypothetical protein